MVENDNVGGFFGLSEAKREIEDAKNGFEVRALYQKHGISNEWMGYAIAEGKKDLVAISRSRMGFSPDLWVASEAPQKPYLVAAALALVNFNPTLKQDMKDAP